MESLPEVSDGQRCVFHGNKYTTLIQVQNTVLLLKDLEKKKKSVYLNLLSLVSRKCHSSLSRIMTRDSDVL